MKIISSKKKSEIKPNWKNVYFYNRRQSFYSYYTKKFWIESKFIVHFFFQLNFVKKILKQKYSTVVSIHLKNSRIYMPIWWNFFALPG